MQDEIHLYDVVALREDLPALNLRKGQVGTIVEILREDTFEVDFSDNDGRTYATAALHPKQLLVLHHDPINVGNA